MSTTIRFLHLSAIAALATVCTPSATVADRPVGPEPTGPEIGAMLLSGTGEKHRVSPDQPVQLGSGYNTITDSVAGDCMEASTLVTLGADSSDKKDAPTNAQAPATAGSEVVITYIEDYKRLAKEMGVSASARLRFWFVSGSAEAEYANRSDFSERSSFLLATSTMRRETERLQKYQIKEDALKLLRSNPRAFFRRCGDQFVAGRIKGASFTAIVEIRDTAQSTRTAVRGKIGAGLSFGGFGASGSIERKKDLERELSRHELYYKVMSVGLPADNPRSIDEFFKVAVSLQGMINRSGGGREAALEFVTRSYEIADNFPERVHLPSLARQDQFLNRLAGLHQETAVVLNDLRAGGKPPAMRPCENSERRRLNVIANLEASNRRIEERARACAGDPERMCSQEGVPDPSFLEARSWLAECSDLEAYIQAKKTEVEQAERAKRQTAESEQRAEDARRRLAAADARRNRGFPGGLPCEEWLLSRVEVEVPEVQPSGGEWDSGGDLPDLYLKLQIEKFSRETSYQKDSTKATFTMKPAIKMKTGARLQLWAWDFDGNGFFGVDREFAVSANDMIPAFIPTSGLEWGNARGTFRMFAVCVGQSDPADMVGFGGVLGGR